MSSEKKSGFVPQGLSADSIPKIRYDTYFRVFGMIPRSVEQYFKSSGTKMSGTSRFNRMYCRLIVVMLWFFVVRTFALMFVWSREVQVMLGDLTGYWNDYRLYYLLPQLFFSVHSAITLTIWQAKEGDLAWLVPFVSVRQMQSNNNTALNGLFRPANQRLRIYLGILFDVVRTFLLPAFATFSLTRTRRRL